jgi:hypothetical protein
MGPTHHRPCSRPAARRGSSLSLGALLLGLIPAIAPNSKRCNRANLALHPTAAELS